MQSIESTASIESIGPAGTLRGLPTVCTTEPYGAHGAPQTSQMARLLRPHQPEAIQLPANLGFGYTFQVFIIFPTFTPGFNLGNTCFPGFFSRRENIFPLDRISDRISERVGRSGFNQVKS